MNKNNYKVKAYYVKNKQNICANHLDTERIRNTNIGIKLGPRHQLYQYIFNEKKEIEEAIELILEEYKVFKKEALIGWLKDKKAIELWNSTQNNDINDRDDDERF